jgi:hypothetical protein
MIQQFRTEKAKGLFVFIKDARAAGFKIDSFSSGTSQLSYTDMSDNMFTGITLPPGSWRILCPLNECTEVQAREVVDEIIVRSIVPVRASGYFDDYRFRNYTVNDQYIGSLETALESIRGLADSLQVYSVNPLGERPNINVEEDIEEYGFRIIKWNLAQQRTGNWIILLENTNPK